MLDGWCALEISPLMSSSVILKGEEICERLNLAFQQTICLGSCLLLTDCSLLSNAHVRNTQNISKISQESNWCQKLRCENQAWPESQFQTQNVCWVSRISSLVVIFIPTKLHCYPAFCWCHCCASTASVVLCAMWPFHDRESCCF